nr:probable inactive purple acid phosphatase 27 [Ipomoea batatas]
MLLDLERITIPATSNSIAASSNSIASLHSSPLRPTPLARRSPLLAARFGGRVPRYNYASFDSSYKKTGKASLKFQLINQRADFSFALFTGGLSNVSISNSISFVNPKAPVYPRLALGKSWNEMTVTWTSGYNIDEAVPVVEWGLKGHPMRNSPAGTLTLDRNSMCGARRRLTASRKAEIILLRGRPPRRCRRHLDRPISDPIPPLVSSFYIIAEKQRRNRCLTLQVMRDSQRKTPDEVSTATGQTAAKSPLPARVEVVDNGG